MQLPIVTSAPIVSKHAEAFRDLFENVRQYHHFVNYLTGLIVLSNKSLTNIARCVLDSADKTNVSRFLSQAPWLESAVNERRIGYILEQTAPIRKSASESQVIIDDTLLEHVGSLFDHIAKHYNHAEGTYPIAHNPVTSHYVSGAVRFPLDLRLYRRYEELTEWEAFVHQHYPDASIPKDKKARAKFHKEVDPILLQDSAFRALHNSFQTKIELAIDLLDQAVAHHVPFEVVLFDSWYLSQALVEHLKILKKDWVSLLKSNRNLETQSFVLRDEAGDPISFEESHIQVQKWVPLIPPSAYHPITSEGKTYWCFTLTVRVSKLGKVRILVSFDNAELEGTYAILVTNRFDWSAQHLLDTYLQRWPIETFYQDGKGHLGLGEYRMRNAEAFGKHWCLVFVAYSFLHLDCLPPSPTKASLPIKTIGQACRQQAQALIENLILYAHDRLQQGQSSQNVFAYLFAKQQWVAT
jgi:SRSO17 transposase